MGRLHLSTRYLQVAIVLGCAVPLSAGLSGVIFGPSMVDHAQLSSVSLDSHFRYLSGLLLGLGLAFLGTVKNIQGKTELFRFLCLIVIVGGLGRLYAFLTRGAPDHSMVFGLVMELVVVPLLLVWQSKIAQQSGDVS